MNNLSKTLLAGVALSSLAAVPALAGAPNIHLAGVAARDITMHSGVAHSKTNIRDPKYTNYTSNITFAGTISGPAFYKTPVMLWGETWIYSSCSEVPNEKGKVAQKATAGKVAVGVESGTRSGCGSTIFTYHGPIYTLKSKTATSDSFVFDVDAKATGIKYNLKLVGTTNLNIGHP
jgi:hypothetical protein